MSSNKRPRLSESEDDEASAVSETEPEGQQPQRAAQYLGESDFEGLGEEQEEDEESDDEQAALQQELSALPFSTLLQAKAALPPATKKRKRPSITEDEKAAALAALEPLKGRRKGRTEPRHGVLPQELAKSVDKPKKERKELAKRSSKHAPMEMSSKRSVTRHRQVVDVPKIDRRDPRFDPTLSQSSYTPSTSYSFLSESKQNELASLRAQVAASKKNANMSNADKEFLQRELTVLESRHAREVRESKEKEVMQEWKKTEREKRKEGKGEFYLKRGDMKKLVESKRKEELAKDPKKEKKVEMRREKKAAGKERKRKPPSRAEV